MRKFLLPIPFIFLIACSTVRFERRSQAVQGPPLVTHKIKQQGFLLGMVQVGSRFNPHDLCPSGGFHSVEISMNTLDVLLSFFTVGLYTPQTLLVTCGKDVAQGT